MIVISITIKLYAPWVHSLKEKRMVVQSLTNRIKNKFNVSIAEVEDQDVHQTIVLGLACVTNSRQHGDSIISEVTNFIERNTEAEIIDTFSEFL